MISREYLKEQNGRIAIERMEDAARTLEDFERLSHAYDETFKNKMRNVERNEVLLFDKYTNKKYGGVVNEVSPKQLIDMGYSSNNIIPKPFDGNPWWRQLMNGSFLNIIFDCPHEIHENISNPRISKALESLNESEKEVLYYMLIRGWSVQKLACFRVQTDRNIHRIYAEIMDTLRRRLKITVTENQEKKEFALI